VWSAKEVEGGEGRRGEEGVEGRRGRDWMEMTEKRGNKGRAKYERKLEIMTKKFVLRWKGGKKRPWVILTVWHLC